MSSSNIQEVGRGEFCYRNITRYFSSSQHSCRSFPLLEHYIDYSKWNIIVQNEIQIESASLAKRIFTFSKVFSDFIFILPNASSNLRWML